MCDQAKQANEICPVETTVAQVNDEVGMGPPGRVLMKIPHDEIAVIIVQNADGKFVLWWFDYVVNEHEESFEDLSVAIARAAVLMRNIEEEHRRSAYDPAPCFVDDPGDFAPKATEFLGAQLT
ncbi:hypothetical protein [Nocardia sp. NRRL S-836]|uniref:hypothetical protein n=1 Tax=Nocardia sp. NRRL S-836 TaxID=1519492 RepID=UPI0006AECCF3|nr:hypothetical protein [Nocardia sp. NRRL S-836]KOV84792.1 hypothetical protein ADL03_16135 [Nocardia sp. NRRL S-836]